MHAERVAETTVTGFALRIYRQYNHHGFVKVECATHDMKNKGQHILYIHMCMHILTCIHFAHIHTCTRIHMHSQGFCNEPEALGMGTSKAENVDIANTHMPYRQFPRTMRYKIEFYFIRIRTAGHVLYVDHSSPLSPGLTRAICGHIPFVAAISNYGSGLPWAWAHSSQCKDFALLAPACCAEFHTQMHQKVDKYMHLLHEYPFWHACVSRIQRAHAPQTCSTCVASDQIAHH